MVNLDDLITYTVVVLLSVVVSAVYAWLTAKNDQFSYPAKLRGIIRKTPWVAMISYPVLIVDYLTDAIPYVAIAFYMLGLAMVALGLLAIIAALFHRQSRERITQPFENENVQMGWGWFITALTGVAIVIVFIAQAIIKVLKAIKWANALTEPSKAASDETNPWDLYNHNNLHEEAREARGEDV